VKVIASIEDPDVIEKIPRHLGLAGTRGGGDIGVRRGIEGTGALRTIALWPGACPAGDESGVDPRILRGRPRSAPWNDDSSPSLLVRKIVDISTPEVEALLNNALFVGYAYAAELPLIASYRPIKTYILRGA